MEFENDAMESLAKRFRSAQLNFVGKFKETVEKKNSRSLKPKITIVMVLKELNTTYNNCNKETINTEKNQKQNVLNKVPSL